MDGLAQKLGVSKTTIGRWEYDEVRPGGENLHQLCRALSIAPGWLLHDEPEDGAQQLGLDPELFTETRAAVEVYLKSDLGCTTSPEIAAKLRSETAWHGLLDDGPAAALDDIHDLRRWLERLGAHGHQPDNVLSPKPRTAHALKAKKPKK